MYVTIRKYADRGGLMVRLAPQVWEGLVPLLRQTPGFRHYCALASEDGHIVSVSVFDDRTSADAANDRTHQWVTTHLYDALPDPPEVLAGEVRRDIPAQGQGGGEGLYVVIRQYEGVQSAERLTTLADEHVVPVIRQTPGLRGHYVFFADGQRVVAVSMFDSRDNAIRGSDQVVGIMRARAKEVAPNPPRVTAGKAVVAATA
jgi:heme-degrading monooxygenase HmoA